MLDQNDNVVPNDLEVLVVPPEDLETAERDAIMDLDWYRPHPELHRDRKDLILVSTCELAACVDWSIPRYTLQDAGIRHLNGVEYIEPTRRDRLATMFCFHDAK